VDFVQYCSNTTHQLLPQTFQRLFCSIEHRLLSISKILNKIKIYFMCAIYCLNLPY
jgi:hypothetical protein